MYSASLVECSEGHRFHIDNDGRHSPYRKDGEQLCPVCVFNFLKAQGIPSLERAEGAPSPFDGKAAREWLERGKD